MTSEHSEQKDPVKIVGVITDQVGVPRNDGTRGSALYEVPFQLSRRPSDLWIDLFLKNWDFPPRFTSMHRPGIARVSGDRIILDWTTIDEVEKYHLETLKVVIDHVNELVLRHLATEQQRGSQRRQYEQEHRRRVEDVAKRLKFNS